MSRAVTNGRGSRLVILEAPSNLGLRPPEPGSVPGCYKLPWALRNQRLFARLDAEDAGCLIPPRYHPAWSRGRGDRNAEAIASYSRGLADRIGSIVSSSRTPLVLGGDCSILIGSMLGLKRWGRFGLVFLDAHSDFRHPGNSARIGAAAGEDLAIVTGRGDRRLTRIERLGPYVRDEDVHLLGTRADDPFLEEVRGLGMGVTTSQDLKKRGIGAAARGAELHVTRETRGFWIHLDADVVDASEIDAVDSPERKGPTARTVAGVLRSLLASPKCAGMEVTIFDPDLDPSGAQAKVLADCLVDAYGGSGLAAR
jgi:arginase